MDIKMKLREASKAANEAEALALQADHEARLVKEHHNFLNTKTQEHEQEHSKSYKFIQIPQFAFTTDLQTSESLAMDDDDENKNEENDEEEQDMQLEDNFDWHGAANHLKALAHKGAGWVAGHTRWSFKLTLFKPIK